MTQETTIPTSLSIPSYVELARLAAKGPFTEATRKLQGLCVATLSVFFLGYFNLVTPDGMEIGPFKLKASIVVVTITSLVLASYFYIRFITEAHIERRLFRLESLPRIDAAKKDLRENGEKLKEWQDQIAAEHAVLQKKVEENRRFTAERDAQIAAVEGPLKARQAQLNTEFHETFWLHEKAETSDERAVLAAKHTDLYEELSDVSEQISAQTQHLRDRPLPYPDITVDDLLDRALFGFDHSGITRIMSALTLAGTRGKLTAMLDLALPSAMLVLALGLSLKWAIFG